jgi:hypothetical protein
MNLKYFRTRTYLYSVIKDALKDRRKWQAQRAPICSALIFLLIIQLSAYTFPGIVVRSNVEASNALAYDSKVSSWTNPVNSDVRSLASRLFGGDSESTAFSEQSMTEYYQALDRDVMILFNPNLRR